MPSERAGIRAVVIAVFVFGGVCNERNVFFSSVVLLIFLCNVCRDLRNVLLYIRRRFAWALIRTGHRKNFFVISLKEWFLESMFRNGFGRWLLAVIMLLQLSVARATDEDIPSMLPTVSEATVEARPFGIAACVNGESIACDEVQKRPKR